MGSCFGTTCNTHPLLAVPHHTASHFNLTASHFPTPQVAYPKHHTQADISDIYLLAAATKGVFVNIALQVGEGGRGGWG